MEVAAEAVAVTSGEEVQVEQQEDPETMTTAMTMLDQMGWSYGKCEDWTVWSLHWNDAGSGLQVRLEHGGEYFAYLLNCLQDTHFFHGIYLKH